MVDSDVKNFDMPNDPGAKFLTNLTEFIEGMQERKTMLTKPTLNQIIFVGGTGRCGKSVVAECLAQHPDAFKLPFELRFLTDPDGIVDFYTSSLASWSPYLMDKRIKRLGRLLQCLAYATGDKYANWRLRRYLPDWNRYIENLMRNLYEFSYEGTWVGIQEARMYHAVSPDKKSLARILGTFVNIIIGDLLVVSGKDIFISDDTWSILFARELSEMLPEAKFIHVYRDPRDVVSSMSRQRWCPSDLEQAARYYLDLIGAINKVPWQLFRSAKFESFMDSPRVELITLCHWLGLDFDKAMLSPLDPSAANIGRWREEPDQRAFEMLQEVVEVLGYE